ncbi:putative DNA-binding transcriptional regulator [Helicobacter cetorum]|uniref:Uncharacterized protein n=1 Tax=Helicobacter cetorum (strain ATCC BAA-429 / MIT 00-7128) TaxID=182217 RepID=I0ELP2_HELC0|nr:putative DNA-binding transcriptional regulator [Helicobacter cetorum]AFI03861.1 hypothetical protein HCW_02900 [Helicobacter cetorum MIT 00-7128]
MQENRQYPKELKEEIKKYYESHKGITLKELHEKFREVKYFTLASWANSGEWDNGSKKKNKGSKAEVRAYYESHDIKAKELARMYGYSVNTIRRWIHNEKWQAKKVYTEVGVQVINDDLTNQNITSFIGAKKDEIKEKVKESLSHIQIDPIIMECIIESSSEELLMQAMTINYINKQILLSAIVARDELVKMIRYNQNDIKGNPVIIACAEKVAKMFSDAKISLFGKENTINQVDSLDNDVAKLSMQELLQIANDESNS